MLASAGTFVKLVPQKLYCYLELLWMFERITQYLYASCYAYSKLANLYCCCGLEPQICNFLSLRHFHPPQLFQEKKRQCNQLGVVCSVWVAEKLETQRASFRKGSGAGGWLHGTCVWTLWSPWKTRGGGWRLWACRHSRHILSLHTAWAGMEAFLAWDTWSGWGLNKTGRCLGWQA